MALFGPVGGGGLLGGGLFGAGGQQAAQPRPVIGLDPAVLGAALNRDLFALSAQASSIADPRAPQGPQLAETPFDQAEDERPLTSRVSDILRADSLIDERDSIVRAARSEPEAQATFIIFNALDDLRTLAEAASEDGITDLRRAELDARFQEGLEEVRSYINGLDLPNLFLLSGERSSGVTTDVAIGRDSFTVEGQVIQSGQRGDALSGFTGSEQFTLRFTRNNVTTDIAIDLSSISGSVTLETLTDLLNSEIASVQATDFSGNPLFDTDGDPVPAFVSRFEIFENEDGDFGLEIRGSPFETLEIVPPAASPGLVLGGTSGPLTGDAPTTSFLTQFADIAGALTAGSTTEIAGTDAFATLARDGLAASEPEEDPDPFGLLDGFVLPSERDAVETDVAAQTIVRDVAVDSAGFIYALGSTQGDFDRNINVSDGGDLFLNKFNSRGELVFSRALGTTQSAEGVKIAIDADDNVVVVGQTTEENVSGDVFDGSDTVVSKFSAQGELLFTRQFDSFGEDAGTQVVVGPGGEIFVGGRASGNVAGASAGGQDALLLQLDAVTGDIVQSTQFGTAGSDQVAGLALAADGNLLVLSEQNGQAVLEKRDIAAIDTAPLASAALGDLSGGSLTGLAVDGTNLYLTGSVTGGAFTGGAAVANPADGNGDGFVLRLTDNGGGFTSDFISFVGSPGTDTIVDLTVSGGDIFVAGTARGDVEGTPRAGSRDAFVARLDAATGTVETVTPIGDALINREASALAFTAQGGDSVVDQLGFALGPLLQTQDERLVSRTSLREGDSFSIRTGGRTTQIRIEADDTLEDLARRIDLVSFRSIEASIQPGSNALRIGAQDGARVELLAGPDGNDALARLGLEPVTLFGTDLVFQLDEEESDDRLSRIGGSFALELNQDFRLTESTSAQFTFNQLDAAQATIRRAFRSLTPNPLAGLEDRQVGPPPPGAAERLRNLQLGLSRLQGASFAGPTSFFA